MSLRTGWLERVGNVDIRAESTSKLEQFKTLGRALREVSSS